MADKQSVRIRIISRTEGETYDEEVAGERYDKDGSWYFRYVEPTEDGGRTIATVKITPGEIRILRHGEIRSEQTFAAGSRRAGYYETEQGTLRIETDTNQLTMDLHDGTGTVAWAYDLYILDELAGHFRLELTISEAPSA